MFARTIRVGTSLNCSIGYNPTFYVKKLVIVVSEIRVNSCMIAEHVCISTDTDTTLGTSLITLHRSRWLAAGQAGRKHKKPS